MQAHATDRQTWLIGIDDTDNLDTRGTGHRARVLLAALEEVGLIAPLGLTRHQLLVDPRIPYTSHNSSACLQVVPCGAVADVFEFCRAHLLETAAEGSDVGLTMARLEQATALVEFGLRAKTEVLEQNEARTLAAAHEVACVGLTGTQGA